MYKNCTFQGLAQIPIMGQLFPSSLFLSGLPYLGATHFLSSTLPGWKPQLSACLLYLDPLSLSLSLSLPGLTYLGATYFFFHCLVCHTFFDQPLHSPFTIKRSKTL
jgi:hypothetical protein